MKTKTIVSGIVKSIEKISEHLSFVTVVPIDDSGIVYTTVPVYAPISPQRYAGKPIDIITERNGFLGRNFRQCISDSRGNNTFQSDYSFIKSIIATHQSRR